MNKVIFLLISVILVNGCQTNKVNLEMPIKNGMVMEVKPSSSMQFNTLSDKLQLYWFGTATHYIQLGEISILTDPFVTTGLDKLKKAESDQTEVENTLGQLHQSPDAIFVGHSHSDHLLDAHTAMLKLPGWDQVKLYGSPSTQNILKGHGNENLNKRVKLVDIKPTGAWTSIPISQQKKDQGYSIEYMALSTAHTPHFSYTSQLINDFSFSKTLLDEKVTEPLSEPPSALDYQSGEVYNYLFRLRHQHTQFTVMMLGSPMPLSEYPDSLPPQGVPVDVVIGLVASADNVADYPKKQIARLKPRVIILSHFNNFFEKNNNEILHINDSPLIDIKQYLLDVQEVTIDDPNFEKIIVPAITDFDNNSIKNVIIIEAKGREL